MTKSWLREKTHWYFFKNTSTQNVYENACTGRLQNRLLMFNVVLYFKTSNLYRNSPFVVTRRTVTINTHIIFSIVHTI